MRSVSAFAATAVAALVTACGGGAGDVSPGDGAAALAAECGAALSASSRIVYVSTLGKDIDNCGGTTATACQSIRQGILACPPGGATGTSDCGVLVRHGLYPTTETIVLRDGVSVYGGCRFDGEADRHYRTTIVAAPALPGAPAISAAAIKTPTVVRDLVVIAADQTAHGSASIAMVVSGSSGLSIVNTTLSSGRGGDGADGSVPASAGPAGKGADGGRNGGAGGPTCAANTEPGTGAGGRGGTDVTTATWLYDYSIECTSTDAGTAGQPAGGGGSARAGLGPKGGVGLWCSAREHAYPGEGKNGESGASGACGAATQPSPLSGGRFDGATWVASRGDEGRAGGVGGGGGGGGAGGACVTVAARDVYQGLPGGGGGGGGCGGGAATAGEQGGASFPLVMVDSSFSFDASLNALVPGPGGRGGRARNAVPGAPGGAPGAGKTDGQSLYDGHYCPGIGAAGGPGGHGGVGSAAAAGHGGPSIGVARVGQSTAPIGLDAVYLPQPGLPGAAGRGGAIFPGGACSLTAGPDGAGGVAGLGAASHDFNATPTNFLAAGQKLVIGAGRTSPNGAVQLGLDANLDLCLTRGDKLLWCSSENEHSSGDELRMQTDGNLCLYKGREFIFCTNTQAHPGSYLVVHDDGHVVVTDGISTFWRKP